MIRPTQVIAFVIGTMLSAGMVQVGFDCRVDDGFRNRVREFLASLVPELIASEIEED